MPDIKYIRFKTTKTFDKLDNINIQLCGMETRSGVALATIYIAHMKRCGRRTSCLNVKCENIVYIRGWSQMYKTLEQLKLQKSNISKRNRHAGGLICVFGFGKAE